MQLGITIPLQKYLNLPKQSYGEPEGPVFLLGNPPDPLSGKRYDDSGQCEQPVWRCFGRHHGFRLEAPSGACRRGGGKRYV